MLSENLTTNPTAAALADLASGGKLERGELTIELAAENILAALGRLKRDLKFERLTSVTAVDRYPAEPRFEVVYHLQSVARKERIRLKARLGAQDPEIESAVPVYRSAD